MKKQSKTLFIIRLIIFLVFAIIAPLVYLIVRFDLFKVESSLQIGLWGVIVLIIFLAVIKVLIKYYLDAMKTKYSYLKQLVNGVSKLIFPLILALVIIIWVKDNMDLVLEALYVIIPCEIVAIFVNPLPRWAFENNVDGLETFFNRVNEKKENTED